MKPTWLETEAVLAALAYGKEHDYVSPSFKPHAWVLEAMNVAYEIGIQDGLAIDSDDLYFEDSYDIEDDE